MVLQHTQCGLTPIRQQHDVLAPYFETDPAGVSVDDPRVAVAHDVALLRAEPRLPGIRVSGLVYDVTTGLAETVPGP